MKDDAISRNAVIDFITDIERRALDKTLKISNGNSDEIMKTVVTTAKAIESFCRLVPSLQQVPCEYYALCRHDRDENKLRADLGFCEYCNEDSDGYVKPLEKNSHAFIRFGMNGWEIDLRAKGWHGSAKIRYCPMCGRDLLVK